jgi:hypothetical protein
MKALFFSIMAVLLVVACSPQASPESVVERPGDQAPTPTNQPATQQEPAPTVVQPTQAPTSTPTTAPTDTLPPPTEPVQQAAEVAAPATPATENLALPDYAGQPLPTDRDDMFSGSGACSVCHTQNVDRSGTDVSTDTFWRSSIMANAARDPYWQATVRSEVLTNPDYDAIIQDKCATCHMPMTRYSAARAGDQGQILDEGWTQPGHELHALAMDGVSCTLCHQILEDGFGASASFSGGFAIDSTSPPGAREAFGPHPVRPGLSRVMQSTSGYIPVQSLHVKASELCATCHTLYTPYLDVDGQIAGEFPEQTPYLEWQASSFGGNIPCQACHMPPASGAVRLSITGGPPHSPFHQHVFTGGNAYMLRVLEYFGPDLAATASSEQFRQKQDQVADQLQRRTANLVLKDLSLDGSQLTTSVAITSMVGHKLPTGFPSRRAWIHLVVKDAGGQVVFESGGVRPNGSIAGNDNDADPDRYEPHYQQIETEDQVQIYESIMGSTEGKVTTTLLFGAGYLKDNRLPPSGFDKNAAGPDIAVYGAALQDEDFDDGGDQIQYVIDLGDAQRPFTVTAELLYQSIGYRWAENMRQHDAPEPARFLDYYDQIENRPVTIATTTAEVNE